MKTKLTRREVLQFVGGSALGVLLSPIPWKVLDDTAIWTQNWPWTPKPMRGDIAYRTTTCTLCPASCGMRSRTVGAQPISSSGLQRHPFSHGALCTTGILAHHLRYHPARLKNAVKTAAQSDARTQVSLSDALGEIGSIVKRSSSVVIVDERPGRTVSNLYREIAAANSNVCYVEFTKGGFESLGAMSGTAAASAGYDLDNARFILSFGAPLMDGWGSPSRTASYLDKRRTQKLVQIEPVRTRTAEIASEWIAARPGSEAALALSIAQVMLAERLTSASALRAITDIDELTTFLAAYAPDAISQSAGIPADAIRTTARAFAAQGPSVAVTAHDAGADQQSAVMLLNILAGSVGSEGGIALRQEIPSDRSSAASGVKPSMLSKIPDRSVNVFILDESLSGSSIPDAVMRKKLVASGGVIVSLAPFAAPRSFAAQYVLPSTVAFETLTDVPGPFDSANTGLALSAALMPAPEGTMDALQFAQKLADVSGAQLSSAGSSEEILKKRVASVHASKRGTVFSASSGDIQDLKQLSSADDLWSALAEGGCWIDAPAARAGQLSCRVMPELKNISPAPQQSNGTLLVVPIAEAAAYAGTPVSPLVSKLSQESGLRLSAHQAYVNPRTAAANGIEHGSTVSLRTKNGTMNVQARVDARAMPDMVFVSCAAGTDRKSVV
jgi:menaquinone reductase, molybdopterin-binding-like subunit